MTTILTDATSFRALADSTAFRLAKESLVNSELREALQTVRLGKNAVRIGDWDILAIDRDGQRSFTVRSKINGRVVAQGLAYYETARMIVAQLNSGTPARSGSILRLIAHNEEYLRVRSDVWEYEARADLYYERGDGQRAELIENRLDVAKVRLEILRDHLLRRSQYI